MNFKYRLPAGYEIRELQTEDFEKLWRSPAKRFFNNLNLMPDRSKIYAKKEINQFKKLREQFNSNQHFRLNLGVFHKNKFVGWTWGFQETPLTFYMCNSAIFEKHRGKGLYSCLVKEVLKRTVAKGFDKIYSRHVITNNNVIIPKLKQGFKITNFELSDLFGSLVLLTYFPSKTKNDILDFRSGFVRPNKKMKQIFKL